MSSAWASASVYFFMPRAGSLTAYMLSAYKSSVLGGISPSGYVPLRVKCGIGESATLGQSNELTKKCNAGPWHQLKELPGLNVSAHCGVASAGKRAGYVRLVQKWSLS